MSYLLRNINIAKPANLRVLKKIKDLVNRIAPPPSDAEFIHGTNLQDAREFQYPVEVQDAVHKDPATPEEEQEVLMETEKLVSDLERARMKELDRIYGTDTYFHPINEVYEERLDSEHVMERGMAKRKHLNQTLDSSRFFEIDPQAKIEAPKIRNKVAFYKELKSVTPTPFHEKLGTVVTNKFETLVDNFAYLETKSLIDPTQKIQVNSPEFLKITEFVAKENIFTEADLFLNAQLEDKIIKDYSETLSRNNVMPLYYDNVVYFTKKESNQGLNLFGVQIDNKNSNAISSKTLIDTLGQEVNVFNQKEIMEFLHGYANGPDNEYGRIPQDLIMSLKYNEDRFYLYDVNFRKAQDLVAITFEMNVDDEKVLNRYITLVKNRTTNTFYNTLLNHDKNEIVFDDLGGVYYIKKNETGRAGFLHRFDLNAPNLKKAEKPIVEEADPLFELAVKKSRSGDYLILSSFSSAGDHANEIYIRPLNDPYQEFHLLLLRSKGIKYKVEHSKDYLIILEEDFIEETQKTKRIRVSQETSSQNLLEAGEKIGDQILRLTSSGLIFKTSQQKSELQTEKSPIESKALVVSRLHGLEKKETKNIYGSLEDFPVLEEGERIKYFAGFEGYVVFNVRKADKEYLKVYNHRSDKLHTLKFNEERAVMTPETNYRYNTPYYHFGLNTPNNPLRILSYNMGLRDLQVIHTEHIVGLDPADYSIEKVEISARDGKEIPVTFVYNKKRMQSDSPIVLHVEINQDSVDHMNFKHEIVGLLNRGFIVAYPHVRGSKDLDDDWWNAGSGFQRLTSVTDIIDTASYLLVNEVTQHICLYGKGDLGGLLSTVAVLKEPELFSSTVLEDPIVDLISYLFDNTEPKIKQTYGDINDKDIYDHTKEYSPYQSEISEKLENVLVLSNADNKNNSHAKKFVAKIRDKLDDRHNYNRIFFKEFPEGTPEIMKASLWQAFIINNIYKKDRN